LRGEAVDGRRGEESAIGGESEEERSERRESGEDGEVRREESGVKRGKVWGGEGDRKGEQRVEGWDGG